MKLATKLLSGVALAVALMNSANASLVNWTFTGITSLDRYKEKYSITFTFDTVSNTFSNGLLSSDSEIISANNLSISLTTYTGKNYGPLYTTIDLATYTLSPTDLSSFNFNYGVAGTYSAVFSARFGDIVTGTLSSVAPADSSATAVPEPEAYAMMLAGLGLVGFAARRKLAV